MIWQMLTKILFNTLSVCCFILIIIVLHGEVADPTVQRDLFMAFLMHTFFFNSVTKFYAGKLQTV